ncbi:hypothetical protein D3C75_467120 [compost metagenome]
MPAKVLWMCTISGFCCHTVLANAEQKLYKDFILRPVRSYVRKVSLGIVVKVDSNVFGITQANEEILVSAIWFVNNKCKTVAVPPMSISVA